MKKKTNVLVGVCAGIAAYKTCELVRLLVKDEYSVKIVMTPDAANFVTPLTFQTLSGTGVYKDMFFDLESGVLKHISLSDWADICAVVPVTANTISKLAHGICDNLLTTVITALDKNKPVILAPAMNVNMWQNSIIQENVEKLKRYEKFTVLETLKGELACGVTGYGRMMEPSDIFKKIKSKL